MDSKRNRTLELISYIESQGVVVNIAKNKARGNKGFFLSKCGDYRIDIAKNLELIFPNGNFTAVDYTDDDGVITGVYKVADKGFVFKASAKGYNASNPIVTLIGMDTEGVIVNVVALEEQETKGVGTKCFEEENVQKLYIGKTLDQQVDGITGATFTSEAMKTMIGKAQEAFREVK